MSNFWGAVHHAVLFIDGRLMVSPRHDDLRSGFQNRRDVLCHFFHDFNADFILLRRSSTLPKHSEQRCGPSRSRRLPEGKDTQGNIYRRRSRRALRADQYFRSVHAGGRGIMPRPILAAVDVTSANFASCCE